MAVRLIALDLDGTALREHREMTERTRETILTALDAGILVVPSTGRSYRDIPKEVRAIPGIPYFLTSNGARVLEGTGRRRTSGNPDPEAVSGEEAMPSSVYTDLIPWERAEQALRILEEYDVQPSVHMGGLSVNLKTADPRVIAKYGNTDYFTRNSADNLAEHVREERLGVEKIFAILFQDEAKEEILRRVEAVYPFAVSASGDDNIELNSRTADKGRALGELARFLGISREDTAVIGDSINYRTMFQFGGHRIAMGNADDSIKAAAQHVAPTCDEDGAAYAMEQLIKGEW